MTQRNKAYIINSACGGGCSRTIKAQYWKNSYANYIRQDGLGASAVLEIWKRVKIN